MEVDNAVVATGELTETQVNAEENKPAVSADAVGGDDPQAIANDGEPESEEQRTKRKGGWARQNERLKEELRVLREEVAALKPTPAVAKDEYVPLDTDKWQKDNPTASYEDLMRAQARHEARWEVKQALKDEKAEQQKSAGQAQFKQRLDEFMEKGSAKFDDFEDVIQSTANAFTPVMTQALLESEHAEEVAYELGSNPEELARIAKLSPVAQVRAMTRLEDKFAKEKSADGEKKDPPAPSKAPAPAKVLTKPSATKEIPKPDSPESDRLSDDEWLKLRRAQVAERKR